MQRLQGFDHAAESMMSSHVDHDVRGADIFRGRPRYERDPIGQPSRSCIAAPPD